VKRPVRVVLVAALLLGLATASVPAANAASYIPITGTGSTWSQNALDQWRKNVAANYGMTVNYSGVGSSAGRRDYIAGTVDFAVSEIPFQSNPEDGSAPETPPRGYAYMPIVAGGTAFMYNLRIGGKRVTNLRLSGDAITKIFTGAIAKWNDPAIQADNPALAMPDKAIVPVVRSDGSGTSAQFTLWMSKQYGSIWKAGMRSQFPTPANGKAQNGSLGVAGYVSQDYGEGAITYVEYSYALKSGFPVAKVLNGQGYYVEPTANSVAVALLSAGINSDLTQNLDGVYNSTDKRSYPLSSYSYMIIPTEVGGIFTAEKGATLGAFTRYMLCEGQQQAPALGYSPLPLNLVQAGSDQIKRIPGAGSAGIDFNSCNNPTFKAGDSPKSNRLAATAPQPAECDKKGPTQCATGTAGATQDTPVTGTGGGGSANGGTGGGGSSDGTGGDSGTGDAGFDENGNPLGGDNASANGAVSKPFSVDDSEMGPSQWLMIAAAVLLFAVILAPPFISRRLRNSRR
jgi:phosphate ABC transporter phosphate-binding protein